MSWHIIPINDLEEHEDRSTCKCMPSLEMLENGDMLFVHNSYDERELREEQEFIIEVKQS